MPENRRAAFHQTFVRAHHLKHVEKRKEGDMANVHYGKIGDIWKHLPLTEILSIESPSLYWESHAGSSHYALTHSPERDYGIFHFAHSASQSEILNTAIYTQLLKGYEDNGQLRLYPGSPLRCHAEFCVETIGKETGQDGGMLETSPEHPLQIAVRSWWWQKNPCHSLEAGNYSHITSSPEILTFPASS